jgi:methionyl aminopeptidase
VPESIARPEYVGRPAPAQFTGPEVRDPGLIERIRVAARIAAQALEVTGAAVRPGITTDEIDRIGHEFMLDHGAYPSTLGYRGFPKSLCTSVNEVVCHGIPDDRPLQDGDIVKIDITAYKDGAHGDNCATFLSATSTRSHGCWSSGPRRRCCAASRRPGPGVRSTSSAG